MGSARRDRLAEQAPGFLAGACAGFLLAWVLAYSRAPFQARLADPVAGSKEPSGPSRWAEAWEDARESLASARGRFLGASGGPDLQALRARVGATAEGKEIEVRDLRGGILEVVGWAPDRAAVRRVLEVLAGAPGVEVVVNRVWTPWSSAPVAEGSRALREGGGLRPGSGN